MFDPTPDALELRVSSDERWRRQVRCRCLRRLIRQSAIDRNQSLDHFGGIGWTRVAVEVQQIHHQCV